MYKKIIKSLLLITVIATPARKAWAQQIFAEGTIKYKVSITPPNGATYNGTYTFFIKNGQVRKELNLQNGYTDVLLINEFKKTYYSLKAADGKKYAIQLDASEVYKRHDAHKGYTLKKLGSTKVIAGINAQKAEITYADGKHVDMYVSTGIALTDSTLFDYFPGISAVPLSFSYTTDNGANMRFDAIDVRQQPEENALFRLPGDYKIVSHKEYEQMKE